MTLPAPSAHTPRRRAPRAALAVVLLTALALVAGGAAAARARARGRAEAVPGARAASAANGGGGGNPLLRYSLPIGHDAVLSGVVRERLDAGPYVYLRVERDDDGGRAGATSVWVASVRRLAAAGGRVTVRVFARAATFDSPRLGRRFAPLLFGSVRPAALVAAAREGGNSR